MAFSTERVNRAFLNFLDGHLFFIFFFLNLFVLQIDESGNLCLYIEAVQLLALTVLSNIRCFRLQWFNERERKGESECERGVGRVCVFFPWLAFFFFFFFFFFSCGFETRITWFVILLLGLLTWECECRVASRLVYCGGMRCWVGWWNCCRLWVGFFCVVSCKQGSYIHQPIWSRCWRWRGCLYTSSRRQDFRLRIGCSPCL